MASSWDALESASHDLLPLLVVVAVSILVWIGFSYVCKTWRALSLCGGVVVVCSAGLAGVMLGLATMSDALDHSVYSAEVSDDGTGSNEGVDGIITAVGLMLLSLSIATPAASTVLLSPTYDFGFF